MPEMLTINLAHPIAAAHVTHAVDGPRAGQTAAQRACERSSATQIDTPAQTETSGLTTNLEQHETQLTTLCQTVNRIAEALNKLHQDTLASHRNEIARLAVEIARKILMYKLGQGDYDIQAIVEEALRRAPTRQSIVIRLNPEDLPHCQQLQQESPDSPFAELEFTPDWSIGRGECLVETPKGIVPSFIEQHLERISEALQKVE